MKFIQGIMKGVDYVAILDENLIQSAEILGKKETFVFQQDNDHKPTSKVASRYFEEKKIRFYLGLHNHRTLTLSSIYGHISMKKFRNLNEPI